VFYSIRHVTRFQYGGPVSESVMEVRKHPRSDGSQRCFNYNLKVTPRARVFSYRDYLGNSVYHFDVPGRYTKLVITSMSQVEVQKPPELPARMSTYAWAELDAMISSGDYWEMLEPSHYAAPSRLLRELARSWKLERRDDPLTLVRELNQRVYDWFAYVPSSTQVDSPIDHTLEIRKGVCQDFAHILITMLRELRIPTRYVSGYLYHGRNDHDRSAEGATHAWAEALLPGLGWVGLDPTNNLMAGERHIRTAIGRDYQDVPPTRGVFKGDVASQLSVAVRVSQSDAPPVEEEMIEPAGWVNMPEPEPVDTLSQMQQQQQQQ
jgi:transglutaminase-like putative cysteine protease